MPIQYKEKIKLGWAYRFNGKIISNTIRIGNPLNLLACLFWSIDALNGTNRDEKIWKYYDVTGNSIPVSSPAANT